MTNQTIDRDAIIGFTLNRIALLNDTFAVMGLETINQLEMIEVMDEASDDELLAFYEDYKGLSDDVDDAYKARGLKVGTPVA